MKLVETAIKKPLTVTVGVILLVMLGLIASFTSSVLDSQHLLSFMKMNFISNDSVLQKNRKAFQFGQQLAIQFMKMKSFT